MIALIIYYQVNLQSLLRFINSMQTFLPYQDFAKTAACLDYRRLGKQRIEAKQIYLALTVKDYGWKQHPAVKMWAGYECLLLIYGI